MPWYKTGKVNVVAGQTSVTGVGTDFAANSLVGDAFIGPDGQWYEVTNVPSATTLSISPAYRSATASNATYALMPVQGYQRDLAIVAGGIIQQWGSTLAGLGTVSTENIVPVSKGGTGGNTAALARAALNVAAVGEFGSGGVIGVGLPNDNADSLSVNGRFCTPATWVGSVFPGTAGRNQGYLTNDINLVTGYKYQRWAPLDGYSGVVERWQVAGTFGPWLVPESESGSNANGSWVKYADGTMVCTYKAATSIDLALTTASGGYYFRATTVTFPSVFVSPPAVTNCTASAGTLTVPLYAAAATNNSCQLFQGSPSSLASVAHFISYIAVGRWKA